MIEFFFHMADNGRTKWCRVVAMWALTLLCGVPSFAQTNPGRSRTTQPRVIRRLPPISQPDRSNRAQLPEVNAQPASTPAASTPVNAQSPVWWQRPVQQKLRGNVPSVALSLERLLVAALRHSPRVQAISDESIIRSQSIIEADAEFDVTAFMESKLDRASDPIGNSLTVGGNGTRFRQEDWDFSAGLRKKNRLGGAFEASQEIGTLNNNSQFLVPGRQGNSRLTLSLNQPLLNGAGQQYNESLIVLAQLDKQAAWSRVSQELQEHLTAVVDAYWELYAQRASLVQKQQHHARAVKILVQLEARRGLDSLQSQILRARAAVATRRAALIRAETMVRNAESRIRALVASPEMLADRRSELLPLDVPMTIVDKVDQRETLVTALENRPEIDEAMRLVSAAGVRLEMSKNELLPVLDAVVEMYVSGLEGDYGIGQSLGDQFSVGEPGYTAGLVFELPIQNRAARARHRRRILELRQLRSQFQDTIQTISSEVEIATREVETSYREMQARDAAVQAAEADVSYLHERWQVIPGEDRAASFILEDLLDAQDRLADEEFRFADSQRAYMVSLTSLRRTTGVLLQHENVFPTELNEDGVPRLTFEKATAAGSHTFHGPVIMNRPHANQTIPQQTYPNQLSPNQPFQQRQSPDEQLPVEQLPKALLPAEQLPTELEFNEPTSAGQYSGRLGAVTRLPSATPASASP